MYLKDFCSVVKNTVYVYYYYLLSHRGNVLFAQCFFFFGFLSSDVHAKVVSSSSRERVTENAFPLFIQKRMSSFLMKKIMKFYLLELCSIIIIIVVAQLFILKINLMKFTCFFRLIVNLSILIINFEIISLCICYTFSLYINIAKETMWLAPSSTCE